MNELKTIILHNSFSKLKKINLFDIQFYIAKQTNIQSMNPNELKNGILQLSSNALNISDLKNIVLDVIIKLDDIPQSPELSSIEGAVETGNTALQQSINPNELKNAMSTKMLERINSEEDDENDEEPLSDIDISIDYECLEDETPINIEDDDFFIDCIDDCNCDDCDDWYDISTSSFYLIDLTSKQIIN
jgi:hypothetical protein